MASTTLASTLTSSSFCPNIPFLNSSSTCTPINRITLRPFPKNVKTNQQRTRPGSSIKALTLDFSGSFFEGGMGEEEPPTTTSSSSVAVAEEKEEPQCPPGLRQYETMAVLRPDMTEDERLALTNKYEELIIAGGGMYVEIFNRGVIPLAYSIKKKNKAEEAEQGRTGLSFSLSLDCNLIMEVDSSNSPQPLSRKPSNFEELSMLQSLLFADSLKDLRNLRLQLYSAAEYFELSYANDDQKQFVVDTLKDYAMKAFINTVDHMGSITYKVNGILDASIEKVSGTELQVSCMEQRLRSCHKFIDRQGHSQQSLMLTSPKHHKRYMLPVGETLPASGRSVPKHQWCSLDDGDDWHHFRNAVRSSIRDTPSSAIRKGRSPSPARPSLRRGATFSFTEKPSTTEKRGPSPLRSMLPLIRTVSLSSRPTTPGSSRSTTPVSSRSTAPTSASPRSRVPPETRKSASMCIRSEKDNSSNEIEQLPTKSKRLLKALLSRRKSKKDDSLYTFLDEY